MSTLRNRLFIRANLLFCILPSLSFLPIELHTSKTADAVKQAMVAKAQSYKYKKSHRSHVRQISFFATYVYGIEMFVSSRQSPSSSCFIVPSSTPRTKINGHPLYSSLSFISNDHRFIRSDVIFPFVT